VTGTIALERTYLHPDMARELAAPVRSHNSLPPAPPAGAFRYWTTREIAILRETYPSGIQVAMAALPGRTPSAIYGKAGQLKLHGPVDQSGRRGGRKQVHRPTPSIDQLIREVYQGTPVLGAVRDLARKIGKPSWWVKKRAVALGFVVPRFKQPEWTATEDAIIEAAAHLHPKAIRKRLVAAGLRRSETAIVVHRTRLGLSSKNPDHHTANDLAKCLGVDPSTVANWITRGWLQATKRGTERTPQQGGDQWWIHRSAVRRFIIDHAAVVDLRKVDRFWFIDLLAGPA
jgi:hypothetical protein